MSNFRGLLDALRDPKNSQGLLDMGVSLMGASGPSPVPMSFGQRFAQGYMGSQQMAAERAAAALKKQYMEAQIKQMQQPAGGQSMTGPLQEYEIAKQTGFTGSYLDFVKSRAEAAKVSEREQVGDPAAVREWQYFSQLSPPEKEQYLQMKRSLQVENIGQVPTVLGLGASPRPLSTLGNEASSAATVKQAEAEGTAAGAASAEVKTKAKSATRTLDALSEAEKLIDQSTGSVAGAARDTALGVFGQSTPGGEAIAKLKVLQANLMTNMPRMEGPQSDKDVQLYREAAGQIGDPKVPRAIRKAAVSQIRMLNEKYAKPAAAAAPSPDTGTVRKYNPQTGRSE